VKQAWDAVARGDADAPASAGADVGTH